jgi:hypothetical protein
LPKRRSQRTLPKRPTVEERKNILDMDREEASASTKSYDEYRPGLRSQPYTQMVYLCPTQVSFLNHLHLLWMCKSFSHLHKDPNIWLRILQLNLVRNFASESTCHNIYNATWVIPVTWFIFGLTNVLCSHWVFTLVSLFVCLFLGVLLFRVTFLSMFIDFWD